MPYRKGDDKEKTWNTLESSLFYWEDWEGDHNALQFSDIELKISIGNFPAGAKFASACVDTENSVLSLYDYGDENGINPHKFALRLEVGSAITV